MAGSAPSSPSRAGLPPSPTSSASGEKPSFVMRWLTTLTVLGCFTGVVLGVICHETGASDEVVKVIRFPGELFIRALKCLVVPMIFASMVSNAAALGDTGSANRMASLAVKFYLSTTFVAAMEGIILFNIFRPFFTILASEDGIDPNEATNPPPVETLSILDTVLGFGRDLVPDNLCKAILETQLLGVITFAIFLGMVLGKTPGGRPVIQFFTALFDAMVEMIRKVIIITPLGVGSLVAGSIAKSDDLGSAFTNIGKLFLVVILGQALHVFGFYASVYLAVTRRNPYRYMSGMVKMWVTAFGTSSSAATLSTTCKTCEDLGVSKRTVNFVLPIGCTVNMDGSALERPIVVLWIAYVGSQGLPFHRQLVVSFMAALMSIGGSPIPSAGVSTLLLMVEAAGVQITSRVAMLAGFCLAIEWLLDSIRTAVNVTGDAVGAAVIDHVLGFKADEAQAQDSGAKAWDEHPTKEEPQPGSPCSQRQRDATCAEV